MEPHRLRAFESSSSNATPLTDAPWAEIIRLASQQGQLLEATLLSASKNAPNAEHLGHVSLSIPVSRHFDYC